MKTLKITAFLAMTFVLIASCKKPDDGPTTQPPVQGGENPTNPQTPAEPEVNPADYLIDGIAFMTTNNQRIPYIMYHTNGAKTAMIDDDNDGFHEIMVHSEDGFETAIRLDEELGLPTKMCSSDGTVALYYYKENNTLLDLAILKPGETIEYARDLTVNQTSNTARTANQSNSSDCNLDPLNLTINGVGYSWKLGGLCEIRDGNGAVSQLANISAQACQNIFRSIHPQPGLSVSQNDLEKMCKQMENQAGVLGLIPGYSNCASESSLSNCIAQGILEIDDIIDNAQATFDLIGEDNIAIAYGALISGYGDVKITLTWDTTSDIDLWVTEPNGNFIYYGNSVSETGGLLDFDDVDGFGPENIFWNENPPIGEYLVQVNYFEDYGEGQTNYTIQLEVQGNIQVFQGTLEVENQTNDVASFITSNGEAGKALSFAKLHKTETAKINLPEKKSGR